MFGGDHAFFCLFFSMPVHVLSKSAKINNKKHAFHQHFRPFRCIKHCKLQYFVFIFFQKPPPHGGPLFGGEMSLHRLLVEISPHFFATNVSSQFPW